MDKKTKNLMLSFIIALVSFSITLFVKMHYFIDDYCLSMVLNGLFDNDNYCLFVSPLLCVMVKYMHIILPSADCYMLLIRTMYFFSIWLIAYYTVSNKKKLYITIPFLLILSFVCEASLTYTITTTYFVSVGMFFCMGLSEYKGYRYSGMILMLFGFLIRTQSALLSLPFIFLEIVSTIYGKFKNNSEINKRSKEIVHVIVPIAICILTVCSSTFFVGLNEDYREGFAYNQARTNVVDYHLMDWEDIEQDTQGVSENDYKVVKNWGLFDTEIVTTDFLNKINNIGSKSQYSFTVKNICVLLLSVFLTAIKTKEIFSFLCIVVVLLCFSLLSKIPKYQKIKNILAGVGGYFICFYFYFCGRMPERVYISIIQYCIASVLLSLINNESVGGNKENRIKLVFSIILCMLSIPFAINWYNNILPKPTLAFTSCSNVESSEEFYSDGEIYIWDVKEIKDVFLDQMAIDGKIPSKDFLDHNITTGSWLYGQKYYLNHFSSIGISNPAVDLMKKSQTYYVGNNEEMIKIFLSEHYGYDKEPIKVKDISGISVWSFN